MSETKGEFWQITGWVLGIILSAFLGYFISIKEREPTLKKDKVTLLIDNNSIKQNPIKIIDSKGAEIAENVSIITFYFFNQGQESIKPDDILEGIKITLPGKGRLLNYKILKSSRDIIDAKLTYDSISNSIKIDFRILEFEDGFTAQILYAGNEEPNIGIDGIIEGVSFFRDGNGSSLWVYICHIGLVLIMIIPPLVIGKFVYRKDYPESKKARLIIFTILTTSASVAFIIWFILFYSQNPNNEIPASLRM